MVFLTGIKKAARLGRDRFFWGGGGLLGVGFEWPRFREKDTQRDRPLVDKSSQHIDQASCKTTDLTRL